MEAFSLGVVSVILSLMCPVLQMSAEVELFWVRALVCPRARLV